MVGDLDFERSGITSPTFFVPGFAGLGNSSLLGRLRLFPTFQGFANIDIVDIGPFSPIRVRALHLLAYIRAKHPDWTIDCPINLVGYSLGCNTILALVKLLEEEHRTDSSGNPFDPRVIGAIVQVSPCSSGLASTHQMGRFQRGNWKVRSFLAMLCTYELLVPLWVRKHILVHTMLPTNFYRFDGRIENTIAIDAGEVACVALSVEMNKKIEEWNIPFRTIVTTYSVADANGFYRIPLYYGLQVPLRLTALLLGISGATDREVGYSFMHENTTTYTLVSGHHDGVVLVQSQLGGIRKHGPDSVTTLQASHFKGRCAVLQAAQIITNSLLDAEKQREPRLGIGENSNRGSG
jgi:alpha/beta superfamily hydrolase